MPMADDDFPIMHSFYADLLLAENSHKLQKGANNILKASNLIYLKKLVFSLLRPK
jgi:hypothetical protein